MLKNNTLNLDPLSLGLGGIKTVSSFAAAPVISYDRLRQNRESSDSDKHKRRLWLPKRYRVA